LNIFERVWRACRILFEAAMKEPRWIWRATHWQECCGI
jgi:hypothetical protein